MLSRFYSSEERYTSKQECVNVKAERDSVCAFRTTETIATTIVEQPFTTISLLFLCWCASIALGAKLPHMREQELPFEANDVDAADFGWHLIPQKEVLVAWCHACDLTHASAGLQGVFSNVGSALMKLRDQKKYCEGLEWSSYYAPGSAPLAAYLSHDKTTAVLRLATSSVECMAQVRSALYGLSGEFGNVSVSLGGPMAVADSSQLAGLSEMFHHELISIPLVCCVLWFSVGSIMRAITPIVVMFVSFYGSRAAVVLTRLLWSDLHVGFNDVPVIFVTLALSCDYALFFWTRLFQECAQCNNTKEHSAAVRRAAHKSGVVIMVSGFVMVIAYSGTLFFPRMNTGWSAMYIQLVCAVVMCCAYSLTFVPALASAFPELFEQSKTYTALVSSCGDTSTCWHWWAKTLTRSPIVWLVPVAAYASMAPFIVNLGTYEPNYDLTNLMSIRTTIEHRAYERFMSRFNIGEILPIVFKLEADEVEEAGVLSGRDHQPFALDGMSTQELLEASSYVAPPGGHSWGAPYLSFAARPRARWRRTHPKVMATEEVETVQSAASGVEGVLQSAAFTSEACKLAEKIVKATKGTVYEITAEQIASFGWMPPGDGELDANCHMLTVEPGTDLYPPGNNVHRQGQNFSGRISKQKQMLMLYPSFEPTGEAAVQLSKYFRQHLEPEAESFFEHDGIKYRFRARHSSAVAVQLDAFDEMSAAAPWVLGFTALAIVIVVAVTFQAAFLPIKLALTVMFPNLVVYGLALFVFQSDGLAGLGSHFGVGTGGIAYNTMYLTYGILFGLAIDYDVFLYARVYEYRKEGYGHLSSVQMALAQTGPVITTAGTLMAVSFFFMMLSSIPIVRILGFIYFCGVCLDTYIVRSTIAPACLCFYEELNFWPTKMPDVSKAWDP